MKNLHLVVLVLLALLIGCAKQFSKDDNRLIITAFSTDFDTKASETAFEAGDKIGVFLENNASNLWYETSDGSTWRGFGNLTQFKAGDNVVAYYPYSQTAANRNAIETGGGVDFMITEPTPITVTGNMASANLHFKHALSKLVVSIKMPEEIAGVKTVSLDSVVAKNVFRKAVVNLADGKISGFTDKGDLRSAGNSAIVIPQTAQKIKLVFKMANGTFDSLAYNTPIVFESGKKTTLNAVSNADLYFTSFLDLKSGEAQTDLPLSFYVAPGRTWTLTSSAPWLTFSATTGIGSATVKVSVAQNAGVPRTATITLKDDKQAVTTQSPMQNYVRTVTIVGTKWTTRNLTATMQGQTSGFTVCSNPQDWGFFWKWGSVFAYEHAGSANPSGHWNTANNNSTGAATQPTAQGHGYDYANISSLGGNIGGPIGDPCKALGANYKTPTHTQWKALVASGKSAWTTYQNRTGYFFGPSANSCNSTTIQDGCIFLPAAGLRLFSDGSLGGESGDGYYWSSSVYNGNQGWVCYFYSGGVSPDNGSNRGYGFSVRCVAD